MQVFDDLHVVRRNHDASVAYRLHFPTLETRDAFCRAPCFSRYPESIQDVLGVSASAYGECNILRLHKIPQLFRKDVFVTGVVCPSCQSREIVSESEHTEPLTSITARSAFSKIASEMRSQCGASTIPKQVYRPPGFISCHQGLSDLVDALVGQTNHDAL